MPANIYMEQIMMFVFSDNFKGSEQNFIPFPLYEIIGDEQIYPPVKICSQFAAGCISIAYGKNFVFPLAAEPYLSSM